VNTDFENLFNQYQLLDYEKLFLINIFILTLFINENQALVK